MDRLEGWEIDALESLVRQYEWSAHDYYSKAYDIEMDSDDAKILEKAIKIIKAIPSAYKGMTNGEVMDKLFPELSELFYDNVFTEDWWNSPYEPQERSE